jgi:hypothetical protein
VHHASINRAKNDMKRHGVPKPTGSLMGPLILSRRLIGGNFHECPLRVDNRHGTKPGKPSMTKTKAPIG